MAESRVKTETLVGAFVLLGILVMGGLILQFGNIGNWVKGSYSMSVDFEEASGVIKGSTVRLRGAKIGEVETKPELRNNTTVRITLAIDENFQIPQGSIFQVSLASFLGDKEIIITPPQELTNHYIEPGSEMIGSQPGGLEFIQTEAETIAKDTSLLLADARIAILKIDRSLDDIRSVAIKLNETVGTINSDVLSEKNVANLSSAIASFDRATKNIADLSEDAGPVLAEARSAIAEIKEATRSARDAIAKIEPALDKVPRTLDSIEKTVDQASDAITSVQESDGALSALTNDKETKEDTQAFIKNLRKYGILRYKDKETKEDDPRERFQGRRR